VASIASRLVGPASSIQEPEALAVPLLSQAETIGLMVLGYEAVRLPTGGAVVQVGREELWR
jgi:hypothetical protein